MLQSEELSINFNKYLVQFLLKVTLQQNQLTQVEIQILCNSASKNLLILIIL